MERGADRILHVKRTVWTEPSLGELWERQCGRNKGSEKISPLTPQPSLSDTLLSRLPHSTSSPKNHLLTQPFPPQPPSTPQPTPICLPLCLTETTLAKAGGFHAGKAKEHSSILLFIIGFSLEDTEVGSFFFILYLFVH